MTIASWNDKREAYDAILHNMDAHIADVIKQTWLADIPRNTRVRPGERLDDCVAQMLQELIRMGYRFSLRNENYVDDMDTVTSWRPFDPNEPLAASFKTRLGLFVEPPPGRYPEWNRAPEKPAPKQPTTRERYEGMAGFGAF